MIEGISFDQARQTLGRVDLALDERSAAVGGCVRSELVRYVVYTWWSDERLISRLIDGRVLRAIRRFVKPIHFESGRTVDLDESRRLVELDVSSDLNAMLAYGDVVRTGANGLAPSPTRIVKIPGGSSAFLISGIPTILQSECFGGTARSVGRVRVVDIDCCPPAIPEQRWEDYYPYADWDISSAVERLIDAKRSSLTRIPASEDLELDAYNPNASVGGRWQLIESTKGQRSPIEICRRLNRNTNQFAYFLAVSVEGKFSLAELSHSEYRLLAAWMDLRANRVIQPRHLDYRGDAIMAFMRLPPDPVLWILNMFAAYEMTQGNRKFNAFRIPRGMVEFVSSILDPYGMRINESER